MVEKGGRAGEKLPARSEGGTNDGKAGNKVWRQQYEKEGDVCKQLFAGVQDERSLRSFVQVSEHV